MRCECDESVRLLCVLTVVFGVTSSKVERVERVHRAGLEKREHD